MRKEIETVDILAQSIYITNTEICMGFLILVILNMVKTIQCNRLFNVNFMRSLSLPYSSNQLID